MDGGDRVDQTVRKAGDSDPRGTLSTTLFLLSSPPMGTDSQIRIQRRPIRQE